MDRCTKGLILFCCLFDVTGSSGSLDISHPTVSVSCETTKGDIKIDVFRSWSPLGADRFIELVKDEYYTDIGFFRCVKRFLTQFGISDNPTKKHWTREDIKDDPNLHLGIKKNYVSFAGGGPNTRSTQIFIAFEDLDFLGKEPWETPFGKVVEGQSTLDALYKGYGDIPPFGKGPDQQKIFNRGNSYLRENFPQLDYLKRCYIIGDENGDADSSGSGSGGKSASNQVPVATYAGNLRGAGGRLVEPDVNVRKSPEFLRLSDAVPPKEAAADSAEEPSAEEAEEAAVVVDSTLATKKLHPEHVDEIRSVDKADTAADADAASEKQDPNSVDASGAEDTDKNNNKADEIAALNNGSNTVEDPASSGEGVGLEQQVGLEHYVNVVPVNRVLPRRNPATFDTTLEGLEKRLKDQSAVRIAMAAVGFLTVLSSILYCLHRQRGSVAAASKKF